MTPCVLCKHENANVFIHKDSDGLYLSGLHGSNFYNNFYSFKQNVNNYKFLEELCNKHLCDMCMKKIIVSKDVIVRYNTADVKKMDVVCDFYNCYNRGDYTIRGLHSCVSHYACYEYGIGKKVSNNAY